MERVYDVNINMLSVISTIGDGGVREGEADKTEASYKGRLSMSAEKVILTHREHTEGGDVYSEITISGGRVKVSRRGAIASDMVFCEGKSEKSLYTIPPHSFDMEIFCKRAKIQIGEREGRVDLLYNMSIGGESRSARMRITWN